MKNIFYFSEHVFELFKFEVKSMDDRMKEELKLRLLEEKKMKEEQNNRLIEEKLERDIINVQDKCFYNGALYCLRLLEKMERKARK